MSMLHMLVTLALAAPMAPLSKDAEIALAISAAPKHLQAGATVYTLERAGYVKVREGQNGLSCLVAAEPGGGRSPTCWDREGSETILPVAMEEGRLRALGKSEAEIQAFVAEGFRSGRFRAARRAGVAYMLSSENYVWNGERVIHYHPHVMIYAPYVTNADIGAGGDDPWMPWVLNEGSPHAYIISVVRDDPPAGKASAGP